MARNERDREDFFVEAVALVRRNELSVAGFDEEVLIGFRREGALSLYFGRLLNFHFNPQKELRRCFIGNLLYKAENGALVSMYRRRSKGVVALVRHELTEEEQAAILQQVSDHISLLRSAIDGQQFEIKRSVPEGSHLVEDFVDWVSSLDQNLIIADTPRVS